MEFVKIGGLDFPKVGLGTFPLKGETLLSALDCAVKNGYGLIDTAYKYNNETEIGNYLYNHENSIIVQTKFSVKQLTYKKFLWLKYGKKTTEDAIKGSIDKLRRECLDVYLLHGPSKGNVEYYGDLMKFREQGKVKVIGVCRFDERQLQDIKDKCGEYPAINQIEVHPYQSNKRIIAFCKDNGIAIEARSLFTHGDALEEFLQSETLKDIASECNKTVPQIIIRWVVQQGIIAIVKSGTPKHIKDNLDVFDFSLTAGQMEKIDAMNKDVSFGCVSKF